VSQPVNLLIQRLGRSSRVELATGCTMIELIAGDVLNVHATPFGSVFFPTSGVLSVTASVDGQAPLCAALIGREGMLGATLALGDDLAAADAFVLISGHALRLPTRAFRHALTERPGLRKLVHQHLYDAGVGLLRNSACSYFHRVEQRLARCLLMLDDRTRPEPLALTHQHLANLLGVRRSAITIASGLLRDAGHIDYSRGAITLHDRRGLEEAACACLRSARPNRTIEV
jgi:CRP-like cAMP-binding protein